MLCHPQITTNMPFNSYIALRFGSTHFHMVNHGNYLRITAKEDLKPTKSCEFQWSWRDSGSGERCTEAWFKGNKEHNENSPNMKSEKNRNPTKGKSIYTAWAATFWKLPWFKKPEKCENMATPGCFAPFATGGFGCPKTWKDWIAGQNKPRGIDVIQYIQESLWVMQFVTGDNQGDPSLGTNVESVPLISVFQAQAALDLLGQHEMVQLESIQKSWVFLVVNYSLESPLKWISLPKMFWPPATTTLNKMWRRLESCFSPTNFTLYLEPKTEVHMRCSEVHGVGYVAEYLGCEGGGTACVIHNVLVTLRDVHFLFVRQPCFEE